MIVDGDCFYPTASKEGFSFFLLSCFGSELVIVLYSHVALRPTYATDSVPFFNVVKSTNESSQPGWNERDCLCKI